MAIETVGVDEGTDKNIAADLVAAAYYQGIKMFIGPDGTAEAVAGDGTDGILVNLGANNDVAVASVVPGTAATNLGKAEDAAHTSGDVGVMPLAVRNDALAALAGTDGDYAPLQVNADGALYVTDANKISTVNSTTATLTSGSTFTGTGEDVSQYSGVTVTVDASHDSASDGMTFQFSSDNSNWDDVYTFTYTAADGARRFQFPVTAQYFRFVYTNTGTNQTHFRVQTILHSHNVQTSIHRLVDDVSADRSATIVKSAIVAQASGAGDFVPVAANATGKLQVAADVDGEHIATEGSALGSGVLVHGDDGTDRHNLQTDTSGNLKVVAQNTTDGGATPYYNDGTATETEIKGSGGKVLSISAINQSASVRYLQLFNALAAGVTPGTTTPTNEWPVPSQGDTNGAGFNISLPQDSAFAYGTGITFFISTAQGGGVAATANDVLLNIGYT